MIVEKCSYKKSTRTGQIHCREKVEVVCGDCGGSREIKFITAKNLGEEHLCASCSAKRAKPKNIETRFCGCCGSAIIRPVWQFRERAYCDDRCRDKHWHEEKYAHLPAAFEKYPDETAYIMGLILGDGHLKKGCGYLGKDTKTTTRVSIAFDVDYPELLDEAKVICERLGIVLHCEPLIHKNCQAAGFSLPDKLLRQYGMCFTGDKFKAQPLPKQRIIRNINFAAGLINSDGYHANCRYDYYKVGGVTESILDSLSLCLISNGIEHKRYSSPGRLDCRTGKTGKPQFIVNVQTREAVQFLKEKVKFKMKGKV